MIDCFLVAIKQVFTLKVVGSRQEYWSLREEVGNKFDKMSY